MLRFFIYIKPILLLTFILIFTTSCGYRPNAQFTRAVLGEKVSTSVIISEQDPENTVIIKDIVDTAVVEVFKTSLVQREYSDSHLTLKMSSPLYTPIVFDKNGYIIGYRMSINLNVSRNTKGAIKEYKTVGFYDFSVAPNAVVTDQVRFEAIGFAAQRAIRAFVAQVSAEGARANK